jgi:hypothetical protein
LRDDLDHLRVFKGLSYLQASFQFPEKSRETSSDQPGGGPLETGNRKLVSMIILIAFKKQQAPSTKHQATNSWRRQGVGLWKLETRNLFQ